MWEEKPFQKRWTNPRVEDWQITHLITKNNPNRPKRTTLFKLLFFQTFIHNIFINMYNILYIIIITEIMGFRDWPISIKHSWEPCSLLIMAKQLRSPGLERSPSLYSCYYLVSLLFWRSSVDLESTDLFLLISAIIQQDVQISGCGFSDCS